MCVIFFFFVKFGLKPYLAVVSGAAGAIVNVNPGPWEWGRAFCDFCPTEGYKITHIINFFFFFTSFLFFYNSIITTLGC